MNVWQIFVWPPLFFCANTPIPTSPLYYNIDYTRCGHHRQKLVIDTPILAPCGCKGIQNPTFNKLCSPQSRQCNPESKHRRNPESLSWANFLESGIHDRSGIRNPRSGIRNLMSAWITLHGATIPYPKYASAY